MKVALLGAESTGKTHLALALADHWRRLGRAVVLVPEVLREWCDRMGRTPRPEEQAGIASEQAARVAQAPPHDWLIADTTPIMVALYSELLFDDRSLYGMAFAHQRQYDITLVTGLDLPWVADGLQRDGPHVREPVDTLLRAALARAGVPYRVIYGAGDERLRQALFAIDSIAPGAHAERTSARSGLQSRPWTCERCADPDCEHRLFTGLWDSPEAGRRAP
ncbi:MAG: ATP-binding protein [Ramlibacter sp.]|nr:ATP-binding protein [Ramlibacter sp.]